MELKKVKQRSTETQLRMFLRFLKDRKIYSSFIIAFQKGWSFRWREKLYFMDYMKNTRAVDFLMNAFSWLDNAHYLTSGEWREYNTEWLNLCIKNKLWVAKH